MKIFQDFWVKYGSSVEAIASSKKQTNKFVFLSRRLGNTKSWRSLEKNVSLSLTNGVRVVYSNTVYGVSSQEIHTEWLVRFLWMLVDILIGWIFEYNQFGWNGYVLKLNVRSSDWHNFELCKHFEGKNGNSNNLCQFCLPNVFKTQNFANLMTSQMNLRHFCLTFFS